MRFPVSHIKNVVSVATGVPVCGIDSRSRDKVAAKARHIAMALAKEFTELSYPAIARKFRRRDHTTVLHAVEQAHGKHAEHLAAIRKMLVTGNVIPTPEPEPAPEPAPEPQPLEPSEPIEPRANKFIPRRGTPSRLSPYTPPRQQCVTGALMGDPGFSNIRIARGERSNGDA